MLLGPRPKKRGEPHGVDNLSSETRKRLGIEIANADNDELDSVQLRGDGANINGMLSCRGVWDSIGEESDDLVLSGILESIDGGQHSVLGVGGGPNKVERHETHLSIHKVVGRVESPSHHVAERGGSNTKTQSWSRINDRVVHGVVHKHILHEALELVPVAASHGTLLFDR